jgi:glycosyltransferase involved in cell wall biosynthesis
MSLRILHTTEFYSPSVGGAQEVVRQVSERLAARGHRVTVATSFMPQRRERCIGGVEIVEFDVRGNAARGMQGEVEAYRHFVLEGGFDVVMMYAAQQWATDALLPILERIPGVKVLAPCGFSGLQQRLYAGYFAGLPDRLRAFDALILHSHTYQDMRFVQRSGVERTMVIPNGADEREFGELWKPGGFRAISGIRPDEPFLLTVGSHTGLKGHAQAMAAFRHARLADSGTLAIVGNTPTGPGCRTICGLRAKLARLAWPGRRILLADPPRHQVLEAYADADLFVFCSAVECSPLVLFEAMAAGLPFISVDVGNAAEIAAWSDGGVIVPSARDDDGLVIARPAEVASAIDELLGDQERCRALRERGRRAWLERFTWAVIARSYEALYEDLAS